MGPKVQTRLDPTRRRIRGLLAGCLLAGVVASCGGPSHPRSAPAVGATTTRPPSTTAAAPTAPTPSRPPATACSNAAVIRSWSVTRRAAQLVVVPVLDGSGADVEDAVAAGAGGMLLLGSVPPAPELVSALAPARTGPPPSRPLVMVDQEGGGVQRLGGDVTSIPWPRQMAETMSPSQVEQLSEKLGRQMAALGVGVDLAPVLDLDAGPALTVNDPDGPRSFSPDPTVATSYGLAFAAGLRAAGVLAVVKHFPGLGGSSGNTDYGPASTRPLAQLESADLIPFERAVSKGLPAVMVANAAVPGLTSQPASVSPAVITGLLRNRLGFAGLVVTDSLSAGAVRADGLGVAAASVAAVRAGADMVLFGSTLTAADQDALAPAPLAAQIQAVVRALAAAADRGALLESRLDEAVLHVLKAKGVDLCTQG